jgi:hypothetical protein
MRPPRRDAIKVVVMDFSKGPRPQASSAHWHADRVSRESADDIGGILERRSAQKRYVFEKDGGRDRD